jgi:pSer/pThr/pTyr-binding forkhead associated (FHA) protein
MSNKKICRDETIPAPSPAGGSSSAVAPVSGSFKLVIMNGKSCRTVKLAEASALVGRSSGADVLIASRKVSNEHVRIVRHQLSPASFALVDLSSNGTWLNEVKLVKNKEAVLCSGDEILLVNEDNDDRVSLLFKSDEPNKKKRKRFLNNALEEALLCCICQDVMHRPAILLPCLHSCCAACISEWRVRSNDCPHCREKMEECRINHQLVSVIEAFYDETPEVQPRTESEILEMDSKDLISHQKNTSQKAMMSLVDDQSEDEDEEEDEDQSAGAYFVDMAAAALAGGGGGGLIAAAHALLVPQPAVSIPPSERCEVCQCTVRRTHHRVAPQVLASFVGEHVFTSMPSSAFGRNP